MSNEPIFCDMSAAPDTPVERLAEYRALFAKHHLRSERTAAGVRHIFRNDPGVVGQLRDLTAREQACCGFLTFSVRLDADQVHWDIGTDAGPMAEAVVEEFFDLPRSLPARSGAAEAQNPV